MDAAQELAPKQARSRETRRRLLAAAETLLETRDWKDITMSDIAAEARSSIGSLYARFPSKQVLFDALDAAYAEEIMALTKTAAEAPSADLKSHLEAFVSGMITFHRAKRGLVRALVLAARLDRQEAFARRTDEINAGGRPFAYSLLRLAEAEGKSVTKTEVSWLLFIVMTMVRERILFPESVSVTGRPGDETLKREVMRAALGYLGEGSGK